LVSASHVIGIDAYVNNGGLQRGRSAYLALGINYQTGTLTFLNSWSDGWGDRGRFRMRFTSFAYLLKRQGDATVPVGREQ
jgi:hypothetical protein